MVEKDQQQPVFQGRQGDLPPALLKGGAGRVEGQIPHPVQGGRPPPPAQGAFDSGDQLHGPKGLDDIIVRAQPQPGHHAGLVARRG